MKKTLLLLAVIFLLSNCDGGGNSYKNPYLPNYSFSTALNLNLPSNSGLKSPINPVFIPDNGSGVNMIVMKISDTDYRAWDAYCPNQSPTSCSLMGLNGINAKCSCEDSEYSLFTGIGTASENYSMRPYRVEIIDQNNIRVYN